MNESNLLAQRLALLDEQREALYQRIAGLTPEALWRQPPAGRWSLGQNLEHLNKTLRLFRLLLSWWLPIGRWKARRRRGRPYSVAVLDVYSRRKLPAPPGLRPRARTGKAQLSYERLREKCDRERRLLGELFAQLDDETSGQIYAWNPFIGWLNMIQWLQVAAYHEAHHLRFAHQWLAVLQAEKDAPVDPHPPAKQ